MAPTVVLDEPILGLAIVTGVGVFSPVSPPKPLLFGSMAASEPLFERSVTVWPVGLIPVAITWLLKVFWVMAFKVTRTVKVSVLDCPAANDELLATNSFGSELKPLKPEFAAKGDNVAGA